ncbi:hypothetical protein QEN19_002830 [Hanseniaspora menglaensis]
MFSRLNNFVDKYFNQNSHESLAFSKTAMSSLASTNKSVSKAQKAVSTTSNITEMFPYLKNSENNSFFSNFVGMVKALYTVSKVSTSEVSVISSEATDAKEEIFGIVAILRSIDFTIFFKILFKYVFSQFSFICIMNAFFLNKVSHMSERNTHHRRTTVRLQLNRQQLISRRDEIARTLNDGRSRASDVLESELLVIIGQLQDVNQQLVNQQLLEEVDLEKEKSKISLFKIFGMALHIINIGAMCYLVHYCEYRLFEFEGETFNDAMSQYCSYVFYMVNWLECCIALNNQFNLIPHRKSILKYEGFTTFDYSLILFMANEYFSMGDFNKHIDVFKFFVYNKLVYEIVTITLEIFQLKHLWLLLSVIIDVFFLNWFLKIISSGIFSSLNIIYDPILTLSAVLLFLLYIPLIISYIFSVVTLIAFFVVAVAVKFKHLETLKYYQVFSKFKTHLSSCEGSEITVDSSTETQANFKRLGTLNFNRSILQFCVFIIMNEKSDQPITQESYVLRAINSLYDSEFGYINKYTTKRKDLGREFKTYPLSLNEMHLDNLISNASRMVKKRPTSVSNNHIVYDRQGESSADFWSILLRINRFKQFWLFIKKCWNIKKIAEKIEVVSNTKSSSDFKNKKETTNKDDFENNYINILTSDNLAFAVDDSLDYEPLDQDMIDYSEEETEENVQTCYDEIQKELIELLPTVEEFLISEENSKQDGQHVDLEAFVDIVKRKDVMNKLSDVVKLPHFTRSYYKKYLDQEVIFKMKHELKKRHDYYVELKPLITKNNIEEEKEESDEEEDFSSDCVICTANKRAIILWPCKCLAICEDCRISLSVKKFDHCPCCRTKIRGYSKINNV